MKSLFKDTLSLFVIVIVLLLIIPLSPFVLDLNVYIEYINFSYYSSYYHEDKGIIGVLDISFFIAYYNTVQTWIKRIFHKINSDKRRCGRTGY